MHPPDTDSPALPDLPENRASLEEPHPLDTATAPEWAVRDELTAKAKAFASDKVLNLWQKSAQAYRRLDNYVDEEWPELTAGPDWQEVEDATEKDPELQKLHQASEQLAARIRTELDAHRRKWWQRRQTENS